MSRYKYPDLGSRDMSRNYACNTPDSGVPCWCITGKMASFFCSC